MKTRFVFNLAIDTLDRDDATGFIVEDENSYRLRDGWVEFRGPGLQGLNVPLSNILYWQQLEE